MVMRAAKCFFRNAVNCGKIRLTGRIALRILINVRMRLAISFHTPGQRVL